MAWVIISRVSGSLGNPQREKRLTFVLGNLHEHGGIHEGFEWNRTGFACLGTGHDLGNRFRINRQIGKTGLGHLFLKKEGRDRLRVLTGTEFRVQRTILIIKRDSQLPRKKLNAHRA